MGWIVLFLTVVFSSFLTITFKYFQKFGVNTSKAIVFNYLTAATLAFSFAGIVPSISNLFSYSWAWAAISVAVLFITLFNLMAITSQKIGITQTSVANKTSFIFPALLGIIFFKESFNLIKLTGIALALVAVFVSAKEKTERATPKASNFILIVLLFLGGGCLDMVLSYAEEELMQSSEVSVFSGYSFLIAGIFGALHLGYTLLIQKKSVKLKKEVIGGIALGCINYFSIFTFLSALNYEAMESSVAFTAINMGIIIVSSVLGALLFHEKMNKNKLLAILLAVFAILLVSFSNELSF